MNINDKDVKRFKETIKKEKDFLQKTLTNDSGIDVYVQAIYMGYLDASRTFQGQSKIKKNDDDIKKVAKSMKSYVEGIQDQVAFDKMFYEVCDKLCKKYRMKFGQAQKIINMAFKYLYCIADEELKERFKCCHMPLDGIMIEWIYRNIKDENNKNLKKISAWSNMSKGDKMTPCSYMYYKKYVDSYCECKETNTVPLQLDFEQWVIMSQTLAAESYLKTFTKDELEAEAHIERLKIVKDNNNVRKRYK